MGLKVFTATEGAGDKAAFFRGNRGGPGFYSFFYFFYFSFAVDFLILFDHKPRNGAPFVSGDVLGDYFKGCLSPGKPDFSHFKGA
ncbi:hypothetical protein AGMMS50268_33870 [Spirochaetia bacterium]|nr:hypothetical protein AGMMS50268_33870 [Spirochaetia bacterium]